MRIQKSTNPNGGGHVYDTEEDMWYEFETQDQIDNFVNEAADRNRDRFEETRGASNFGAFAVPVTTQPGVALNFDPDRAQVRLKYDDDTTATSSCLVGRKEQLQGSNPVGYELKVGQSLNYDSQGEVWVIGLNTPSVKAKLSIAFTTLLP